MTIRLHRGDLPDPSRCTGAIAIDTETMGLDPHRDRLCLAQLSAGDGVCHLVKFAPRAYDAPNLKALLINSQVLKIFHFGRFDIAMLQQHLGVLSAPVYCTKIASRLVRTFTDRHGLKDLTRELVGVEISKQQQSSDWGAETLTDAQLAYAASDVLYLHAIREKLDAMLAREGRAALAQAAFAYLPERVRLDLAGLAEMDVFSHGYP